MVSTLATAVAPVPVSAYSGPFTAQELPVLLAKVPCILIACRGISRYIPYAPGQWQGVVGWVAYCFGTDQATEPRAQQAMRLAESVLAQMTDQQWGLADTVIDPPDFASARADNLDSDFISTLRVAVWGVSWNQTLTFSA
jgi:hypothetical protein